mgnify:CR=1 FL=1
MRHDALSVELDAQRVGGFVEIFEFIACLLEFDAVDSVVLGEDVLPELPSSVSMPDGSSGLKHPPKSTAMAAAVDQREAFIETMRRV